jgi:hypothetical protein
MEFYLNFDSPTLNKSLKLKEVSFEKYRILNKFLINNNNFHISEYFDVILNDCLIEKEFFTQLTNFDKFCALFLLRCISVSPEVEFKKDKINSKASLMPFLKTCLDFKIDFLKTIKLDENIKITLSLPKQLAFENMFDIYYDSINKVFYNEKEIVYPHDRSKLIEMLPAEITNHLKKFADETTEMFKKIVLNIGLSKEEKITITPFNLSFIEILKALYSANLKSIMELQYLLVSKMFYSPEYVDKNTLAENLVLANIYEAEVKKLNEEQAKSFPIEKQGPPTK